MFQCCQHCIDCQVDNINSTSTWAKITWAINGKEYNYSPDSEVLISPPRTRVLDEVKEKSLNGNNQGIDGYLMITSFFTFQGISSVNSWSWRCWEGEDRPMCDRIKCTATHDTFEEPISQYFMLVYERSGDGNGCC